MLSFASKGGSQALPLSPATRRRLLNVVEMSGRSSKNLQRRSRLVNALASESSIVSGGSVGLGINLEPSPNVFLESGWRRIGCFVSKWWKQCLV